MYSKILQISKKIGIPVKKILDIFYILKSGESIENNKLIRTVGVSKNVMNQIKSAVSNLFEPVSKNTQLSKIVLESIRSLYESNYLREEQLWLELEGKNAKEIIKLLEKYSHLRPSAERKYDQFTATLETTAKRANLLNFFGDIKDKRILFLGDDDFTSVATASFKEAEEITVLDIDPRVLGGIEKISNEQRLNIQTIIYDARVPLPSSLVNRFDVVFTDPPYTTEGIKLFVSRGVEALDLKNQAARIYVCYGNSDRSKERFLPIYNLLTDSGLMIRWIFDKFNRYQGAESIGSASSLFILEVTSKTKPLITGNYDRPIYTNN